MKKSDLYREWARVLDMCEGTAVMPWRCVVVPEIRAPHRSDRMPDFDLPDGSYGFAVAILEGKPVFVGDRIFIKNGHWITVESDLYITDESLMSWSEPKKTFMLNGVELPRPDCEDGYMFLLSSSDQKKKYYFNSLQDRNKFADAVIDLIEDALK